MSIDDMHTYIELLRETHMFRHMPDAELQRLVDASDLRRCIAGEMISSRTHPADGVCVLLSGVAKVSLRDEKDHTKTLYFISQRCDTFGDISLFTGRTDADVVAYEDVEIMCIPRDTIMHAIRTVPDLAVHMLGLMADRLNEARRQINYLTHLHLEARVAVQLLKLAHQFGTVVDSGTQIQLVVTHQEIADMVGTNRETVTRIINAFKKRGLITVHAKHIIIADRDSLEEVVSQ